MKNKKHIDNLSNSVNKLSIDEIKKMIESELSKNESEIDMDYVDTCYELLQVKSQQSNNETKTVKLSKRSFKAILIAATLAVFTIATISVSANAYTIPNDIAPLINGNAVIDRSFKNVDTTADGYTLTDTPLAKELESYGISPVTYPELMLSDKCEILSINNQSSTNNCDLYATIDFKYKNCSGDILIEKYNSINFKENAEIIPNVSSGILIQSNGLDVIVLKQKSCSIIYYSDSNIIYTIKMNCEYNTVIDFAKSIK